MKIKKIEFENKGFFSNSIIKYHIELGNKILIRYKDDFYWLISSL